MKDYTPEERYKQRKEMYYFHSSYTEMAKLSHWRERAEVIYCTEEKCIESCPYYDEKGRVEDHLVVDEFIESTNIAEIKNYKKELRQN